jgi:HlyD family secretion protein
MKLTIEVSKVSNAATSSKGNPFVVRPPIPPRLEACGPRTTIRADPRPNRRPNRCILLLTLIAAAVLMNAGCKSREGPPRYATILVSRGNIAQHVTASGSLSALQSIDVGSQVSGKISALYVDFNAPVKKGQLIAEIDPTVYEAALRQAEGDLSSARADLALKQQNLERTKLLAPIRAASQSDLDQAVAQLAQAEATVRIKQAAVESGAANLGYCKITAPVDGVVISRKVDLGQTVIAAMSTPVLFTIAQDINKMNITADVSEADIGRVRMGQSVAFTVDAFPDEVFHGRVTQVRKAATTTQNVVTYQTIIAVNNPGQRLFPGMTANVSILVAKHTHALEIPNAALRYAPPEGAMFEQAPTTKLERGQQLVYAPGGGGITLRPIIIKTGITDGLSTEVLEGVTEGMPLVTSTLSSATKGGGFGTPSPQTP